MKRELLIVALASFATICAADDAQSPVPSPAAVAAVAAVSAAATAARRAARPRQVAIGTSASAAPDSITAGTINAAATATGPTSEVTNGAPGTANGTPTTPTSGTGTAASTANSATGATAAASSATAPQFASEAKWVLAGYNSDEIVYTVFVTNQDPRIIRCTTEVKGFYFENGAKLSIEDRQITTVFPNQPTRVGYWMDMDQQSGATYSVKCHPV